MKVLLDENIDIRFKLLFQNSIHEVFSIKDMQWNGIKNGALLKLHRQDFTSQILFEFDMPEITLSIDNQPLLSIIFVLPILANNYYLP